MSTLSPKNIAGIFQRPGDLLKLLIALAGLAGGLAAFLLALLILLRGKPWAFIVYAENPYAHALAGLAGLAVWHGFRNAALHRPANWRPLIGRTLLMLFSLVFCFLAGELMLRRLLIARQAPNSMDQLKHRRADLQTIKSGHPLAAIIQPSDDLRQVYELQPDLKMIFGNRFLKTNHAGMRDSLDYTTNRSPHSVRIVGVGDSGMFGWNVEQGGDYMSVLEQNLNARSNGVAYEVLNLAVPGYNSQLEAERLRVKGLAYHPDVVVVGWCENDGQLPFFLMEKENFHRRDVSFLHMLLFQREDFRRIASGYQIKDLRDFEKNLVDPSVLSGTEAAGLEKAFLAFRQMSDENGFRLLFFGPIGKGVCALLDRVGIAYYNTYKKIDPDLYPPEWAILFMHPSPEGHALLARYLEAELEARGWLTPLDTSTTH